MPRANILVFVTDHQRGDTVPAVPRRPEGIPSPGRRADQVVSLADFAPTFLEAAGIETDRYSTRAGLVPYEPAEAFK